VVTIPREDLADALGMAQDGRTEAYSAMLDTMDDNLRDAVDDLSAGLTYQDSKELIIRVIDNKHDRLARTGAEVTVGVATNLVEAQDELHHELANDLISV